jgi:hypothetical protein
MDFHVERPFGRFEERVNSQCRRKDGAASEGRIRQVWAKKSPLYVERAESISGGDMEETSTNIHMGLVRRNNFLRENPISCEFVAVCGKTSAWRAFGRYEEAQ